MGDGGHGLQHGLLEGGLQVFGVVHQVEAVGNGAGLKCLAVPRGECGAVFGFVGVGGFVQVNVCSELPAQGRNQGHERGRFLHRGAGAEAAVGVDGVVVPALDTLPPPGADAGGHQPVHAACVAFAMRIHKAQGAQHAAGFITMHTAGDQHRGQARHPLAGANGVHGVAVIAIGHFAVAADIKARAQAFHHRQHIVGIAALAHLPRAPLGLLGRPPGLAGGADGVGRRGKSRGVGGAGCSHGMGVCIQSDNQAVLQHGKANERGYALEGKAV